MNAIEKRARELLAEEFRKEDQFEYAHHVAVGGDVGDEDQAALRAVMAALTPPEGYALVPVELTPEMVKAVYPLHYFTYLGSELREHWRTMIAARPGKNQ